MQLNHRFRRAVLAALLVVAIGQPAFAADAQRGPSAADLASLRNYPLTAGFLEKWLTIAADPKAPVKSLDLTSLSQDGKAMSLDAMTATLNARPGISAYLASQGLTGHDYVLGGSALMMATFEDIRQLHPEMSSNGTAGVSMTSPANLAFYRQHKKEIHLAMQAAGRQQLQADMARNGGNMRPDKIGPCLKLAIVSVGLAAMAEPGTDKTTPEMHLKLAQSFNDISTTLKQKNLRDDVNDMADEIRLQANASHLTPTPRFTRGFNDMTAWLNTQCN
ncbi:hypothetical protein [Paraburkholderia fungorum]|uniref:Uncharacterized protein n=1 Tax=Paraburkholderia fungorum TaxID=134537 RepID=A0A3R7HE95_9BURK|nr:hypothetical protein [Paraburkholderia fungorum]RKF38190.1 hypothetical protein BCY88_06940 [Paraburkholderia fungorum]